MNPQHNDPVLLVKWHETANWLLDKVDSFPKTSGLSSERVRQYGHACERLRECGRMAEGVL